jgi:glucose-1-phosphate thymidylyltransferase
MNNNLEAILLAGGNGNRLKPFSLYTSKHLLPIDNVPMIFYPLKNLQLAGVKKVYLIVNQVHVPQWELLINAYDFGMQIIIIVQDKPLGIPDAIACCEEYIKGDNFLVALGDNVIIASNFVNNFKSHIADTNKAVICGFNVSDPSAFGVAEVNNSGKLIQVIEKPINPPSNIAIAGFYSFPRKSFSIIKSLKFSDRGELEIADLINHYINKELCNLILSESQSDYWMDTGTNNSLIKTTNFIRDLKAGTGHDIAQFPINES